MERLKGAARLAVTVAVAAEVAGLGLGEVVGGHNLDRRVAQVVVDGEQVAGPDLLQFGEGRLAVVVEVGVGDPLGA